MTESSFDYLYEGEGVYTIRIVANNAEGCVSEKTETVTVYPLPTVDFPGIRIILCREIFPEIRNCLK